jgi:hypothetical protein
VRQTWPRSAEQLDSGPLWVSRLRRVHRGIENFGSSSCYKSPSISCSIFHNCRAFGFLASPPSFFPLQTNLYPNCTTRLHIGPKPQSKLSRKKRDQHTEPTSGATVRLVPASPLPTLPTFEDRVQGGMVADRLHEPGSRKMRNLGLYSFKEMIATILKKS